MKRLVHNAQNIVFFLWTLLGLVFPLTCETQQVFELSCAAGSTPLLAPTYNPGTQKYRAWVCVSPNGTVSSPVFSSGSAYTFFGNTANPLTALNDPTTIQDVNGSSIMFDTNFGQSQIAIQSTGSIDIDTDGDYSTDASTMEFNATEGANVINFYASNGITFNNNVFGPQFGDSTGDNCDFSSSGGVNCGDAAGDDITLNSNSIIFQDSAGDKVFLQNNAPIFSATSGFYASTSQILAPSFRVAGNVKFSASGCVTSTTGGATAGKMTSGTTGTCTPVITMGSSQSSTNGWACSISDETTANLIRETASTSTTVTFSGTTVSGDVLVFGCIGF